VDVRLKLSQKKEKKKKLEIRSICVELGVELRVHAIFNLTITSSRKPTNVLIYWPNLVPLNVLNLPIMLFLLTYHLWYREFIGFG